VLAIDISLPCLTFSGILRNFRPETDTTWWTLPLWWLGSTALFAALTFICSFVSKAEYRREFRVSLLFQNGIFFPLAIIAEMYGTSSLYWSGSFSSPCSTRPSSSTYPPCSSAGVSRWIPPRS
jgi:predicted permease